MTKDLISCKKNSSDNNESGGHSYIPAVHGKNIHAVLEFKRIIQDSFNLPKYEKIPKSMNYDIKSYKVE